MKREVMYLAMAFLIANLAGSTVSLLLPLLFLDEYTESKTLIALLASIPSLMVAIGTPFFGWISDRTGRRILYIRMSFFASGICLLAHAFVDDIIHFYFLRAVLSLVGSAPIPLVPVIITLGVKKEERGEIIGKYNTVVSIGGTSGFFFGGAIAELIGIRRTFVLSGLLTLLSTPLLYLVKEKKQTEEKGEIRRKGKEEDDKWISREIISLFFLVLVILIGSGAVYSLLPVYFKEIGFSESEIGVLMGTESLAYLATAFLIGKISDLFGRKKVLFFGIIGYPICYFGYYSLRDFTHLILVQFLSGIKWGAVIIPVTAVTADLSKEKHRGKAMSLIYSGIHIGWIFGPILGGLVSDTLGMGRMILTFAILPALALFLLPISASRGSHY